MKGYDAQLTLQKLEVFCTIAELQSVTRAASKLCISQPVVTAHVRNLEQRLGASLIKRDGRGIALTEAGIRVHKWAQGVVTRTRELERELSGALVAGLGRVTVAANMSAGSYLLPPVICDFYERFPEGRVQVIVSTPQAALDAVRAGGADFAVVMLLPEQNMDGLIVQRLWNEPLLLVSAPASRWMGDVAQRDDLQNAPFISSYSTVMQQLEEGQVRANGIAPRRIVLELGHPEAQKEAVRRDVGVCFFLRSSVQREIDLGELRQVKMRDLTMNIPLYLVRRKDKELSPFQQALYQHIESARPPGVESFAADEPLKG